MTGPEDTVREWTLDPESPYYDEFSGIRPGQWWIDTPNGVIGCSAEEDARTILALLAERDRLQHIIDCADTPLMRDVLAERDRLRGALREVRTWIENYPANSDPSDEHAWRELLAHIAALEKQP